MAWICPIWPSPCLATRWAPICKKPCRLAVSLIKEWKIADLFNFFRPFLGPTRVLSAVFALLAMFCSWHTTWRFWSHQEGWIQRWFEGKPLLWKNGWFMAYIWPYSQAHIWPYSQLHSLGCLQGHLWVTPTIVSCFYGLLRLFSFFVSELLPHTQSKTPHNTVFWPKILLLDPWKVKK